jgi:hypothetical protein
MAPWVWSTLQHKGRPVEKTMGKSANEVLTAEIADKTSKAERNRKNPGTCSPRSFFSKD